MHTCGLHWSILSIEIDSRIAITCRREWVPRLTGPLTARLVFRLDTHLGMPKPSSSRGSAHKKRGRGSHNTRGGRQNKRQEDLIDERRPDSAVDVLEENEESGEEDARGAS